MNCCASLSDCVDPTVRPVQPPPPLPVPLTSTPVQRIFVVLTHQDTEKHPFMTDLHRSVPFALGSLNFFRPNCFSVTYTKKDVRTRVEVLVCPLSFAEKELNAQDYVLGVATQEQSSVLTDQLQAKILPSLASGVCEICTLPVSGYRVLPEAGMVYVSERPTLEQTLISLFRQWLPST